VRAADWSDAVTIADATALRERFSRNMKIASANRGAFALDAVTAVSLIGPAGSGKTALVESMARRVAGQIRLAAIIGNLAAQRDAERLARSGVLAVAVQTDNLAADDVRAALPELNLSRTDMIFIEGGGNTLSPVEFDLGQDLRIAVFSVAGGDEKAAAYPRLVAESDMVLLTKSDLLPYVSFDMDLFRADIARLNPSAEVIATSARSSEGVNEFLGWIMRHWSPSKAQRATGRLPDPSSEWFFE
jgi:hydrogenase nickel incorporation protein HypB